MHRSLLPAAQGIRRGAIALLLTAPLLMMHGQPAEANFLQKLRGVLRGDTQEGAQQGDARGAAIRDRRCAAENPAAIADRGATATPAGAESQLIILVPNTLAPINTVSATPEVFVYIPPDDAGEPLPTRALLKQNDSVNKQIDLEDIEFDDVIDQDILDEVERTQQPELVLELELGSYTAQYSLPEEALIARIQIPEATALAVNEAPENLRFRLTCTQFTLQDLSGSQAEANEVESGLASTRIQRIPVNNELSAALNAAGAGGDYQLYLDNEVWFEMVAALAVDPTSPEWKTLLEELAIPPVNPVPQTLTPLVD